MSGPLPPAQSASEQTARPARPAGPESVPPLAEMVRSVPRAQAFKPLLLIGPWLGAIALALAVHYGAGALVGAGVINEYWVNVVRRVGVFVIAAVSLNIVNGFTGQFSMGHAGFMAIGGYLAAGVTYYGSLYFHGQVGDPAYLAPGTAFMLAGIFIGALAAAGAGYLVGLPSLRLRGDYLAIVTLGFGEIIRVMLELTGTQVYDADAVRQSPLGTLAKFPFNGPAGFERIPPYATLFWVYLFVAVTAIIAYRVKQSSSGRAFLSIREDEIAARAMGVDLTKYKVRAFVLAAFFGAIAGGLYAHTGVNPSPTDAGFQRSFEIIIIVVLGGLGSISGSILAAVILIILPEALREFREYRLVVYALLLIGMMLVRPQGLFGVREIWDFFGHRRNAANGRKLVEEGGK